MFNKATVSLSASREVTIENLTAIYHTAEGQPFEKAKEKPLEWFTLEKTGNYIFASDKKRYIVHASMIDYVTLEE